MKFVPQELQILWKYRLRYTFVNLFKIFLKSTTGGSIIDAAPQLVGGINLHRKKQKTLIFIED